MIMGLTAAFNGPFLPAMNHSLKSGTQIQDRYLIQRQLGQGQLSNTYLAEDTHRFYEPCIVKEFIPQEQDPKLRRMTGELFERQAKILYALDHPQIANFREFFRSQDYESPRFFLVRDYVEGQTYREILQKRSGGLGQGEVITWLAEILPVVGYLHRSGVVHRDLCPENIVCRADDSLPVLIDFGSAKAWEGLKGGPKTSFLGQPTTGSVLNQLGKMSFLPATGLLSLEPELDLYCLGVTAWLLLTGSRTLPASGGIKIEQLDILPISADFRQFLQKILAREGMTAEAALNLLKALPKEQETEPVLPLMVEPWRPLVRETEQLPTEATPLPGTSAGGSTPRPPRFSRRMRLVLPQFPRTKGCLSKLALLTALMALSAILGWGLGLLWLNRLGGGGDQPTPAVTPHGSGADDDLRGRNELRARLLNLRLPGEFFNILVNDRLGRLNPQAPEKNAEPAPLGDKTWLQAAQEMMTFLESLSPETRQKWQDGTLPPEESVAIGRVNRLRLSSRTLQDLVQARWRHHFPGLEPLTLNDHLLANLKAAITEDIVGQLEADNQYELLTLKPGQEPLKRTGTLAPGQGRAYALAIEAPGTLEVNLEAPQTVLFSLYSPTGQSQILSNATARQWSGSLSESGYYEFVIVSQDSQEQNYELTIHLPQP